MERKTNCKLIPKQRTTDKITSRRNGIYLYYLKVGNDKLCVCRSVFLNTLGLKESTLRYWQGNKSPVEINLSKNCSYKKENVDVEVEIEPIVEELNGLIIFSNNITYLIDYYLITAILRQVLEKSKFINTFLV